MKSIHFLALLGLLAACNSTPKETKEEVKQDTVKKDEPTVTCYQYAAAGDTIRLTMLHTGANINGMLLYKLKEKDMNVGTIKGLMRGDVLVADYTFKSEGTESTRQVAFKKTGNSFVEGYGESVNVNGVEKFKDVDAIVFSSSMQLQEVPCK